MRPAQATQQGPVQKNIKGAGELAQWCCCLPCNWKVPRSVPGTKNKTIKAVPGLRKCGLLPLRSPQVCTISFQPLTPPSLGMEPKGSLALSYIPNPFYLEIGSKLLGWASTLFSLNLGPASGLLSTWVLAEQHPQPCISSPVEPKHDEERLC